MGTKPVMSSFSLSSKPPLRPAPPPPVPETSSSLGKTSTPAPSSVKPSPNPKTPSSSIFKMPHSLSLGSFKSRSKESMKKKVAPPRPPPPKLAFSNRSNSLYVNPGMLRSHSASAALAPTTDTLIDWSSPPSSPVFEVASSSDGMSIHSFGSDHSLSLSSWNQEHPRSESGFESQSDLASWQWNQQTKTSAQVLTSSVSSTQQSTFYTANSMPTIIKPKLVPRSKKQTVIIPDLLDSLPPIQPSMSPPLDEDSEEESPPEPSVPPPPPPREVSDIPCAMALYDYKSGQAGDLIFQEGDVLYLTEKVNEEWYKGLCGEEEGMFPANFVNVLIPLAESYPYKAEACYDFRAESHGDLSLSAGQLVFVDRDAGGGWLYGRCSGRIGQFPSSFVKKVS